MTSIQRSVPATGGPRRLPADPRRWGDLRNSRGPGRSRSYRIEAGGFPASGCRTGAGLALSVALLRRGREGPRPDGGPRVRRPAVAHEDGSGSPAAKGRSRDPRARAAATSKGARWSSMPLSAWGAMRCDAARGQECGSTRRRAGAAYERERRRRGAGTRSARATRTWKTTRPRCITCLHRGRGARNLIPRCRQTVEGERSSPTSSQQQFTLQQYRGVDVGAPRVAGRVAGGRWVFDL